MDDFQIKLKARNDQVLQAVTDCAKGRITYTEACRRVEAMGFSSRGVYEAVRAEQDKGEGE